MSNSLPNVTSTDLQTNLAPQPSPLKTLGFALAIIIGIGGLAAGSVGVAAFLKVGTLSGLGQVNAIIMMAAGGGGGILFLLVGIVGSVKNCQPPINSRINPQGSEKKVQIASGSSSRTNTSPIYGPKDFESAFKVKILDEVPKAPEFDWNAKDPFFDQPFRENYVLLYIPYTIRVQEEEKKLNLKTFHEITKDSYAFFESSIIQEYGESIAAGWVLLSKTVIPKSCDQQFAILRNMVGDNKDFRVPHLFEICVLKLLLKENEPASFFTFSSEEFPLHQVAVGDMPDRRVNVYKIGQFQKLKTLGVACASRKFRTLPRLESI